MPELLLTKIETPDSLTQSAVSDYDSARRRADRQKVWAKVEGWRKNGRVAPVSVDILTLGVSHVSRPDLLARRDMPATSARVAQIFASAPATGMAAQ